MNPIVWLRLASACLEALRHVRKLENEITRWEIKATKFERDARRVVRIATDLEREAERQRHRWRINPTVPIIAAGTGAAESEPPVGG